MGRNGRKVLGDMAEKYTLEQEWGQSKIPNI